jgi:glyoxylase-like metal-dependent hydrolase (beta-lactamase superfamily II)
MHRRQFTFAAAAAALMPPAGAQAAGRAVTYSRGWHAVGRGVWAYLQPDGGWGLSNAGLIAGGGRALLVDTLFDMRRTREMLAEMPAVTGVKADDIATVVNTHSDPDHTFGNACLPKAEIITSAAAAAEASPTPATMAGLLANAPQMGPAGKYLANAFGAFDFAGVDAVRRPTRTFSGELALKVGERPLRLIEVGPAHTKGDVIVYAPTERALFTGDILFIGGTPILWEGPVKHWVAACDRILAMDVDVIVPGHGPVTDKAGVRQVREYLVFIDREARKRFDAGMSVVEAARDIPLGPYAKWGEPERIAVNVDTLYREYDPSRPPSNKGAMWGLMAQLKP